MSPTFLEELGGVRAHQTEGQVWTVPLVTGGPGTGKWGCTHQGGGKATFPPKDLLVLQ